jgi:hypothetical protein
MSIYAGPGDTVGTGGGGGPDTDDPRGNKAAEIRSTAFVGLTFGFALGGALVIFSLLFDAFFGAIGGPMEQIFSLAANSASASIHLGRLFIIGLIIGVSLSTIYNMLAVRRIQIFGLEQNVN